VTENKCLHTVASCWTFINTEQCDELDIRDYISSCLPLSKIQILPSPCISSANWTNMSLGNKFL